VLMVVGVKMLISDWLKTVLGKRFNFYLLTVIFLILAVGIIASLLVDRRRASRRQG
jgi:predicted tellurium resistance membrane protein TerC